MSETKERLKVAALLVVCIGVPWIGWALTRLAIGGPTQQVSAQGVAPTYAELIAIILTAVTVVLAVLALVVAVLAIWGYTSIKKEAVELAARAIQESTEDLVSRHVSEPAIRKLLLDLAKSNADGGGDYPKAFEMENETPKHEPIGKEYPGDSGDEG